MRKMMIYFLVISLMAAGTSGCERSKTAKEKHDIVPVKVMKVKLEDVRHLLEYGGSIKGKDEALVYPKIAGKIIEKVKEDGNPVAKGEAIAYIDRDEIGLKFEKAPVESPLDGIVGRVYVDIGASVTPETPVALVTKSDTAKIDLDIPEKYLPKISLGQEAIITVDAYPDQEFIGKVTKISPILDLATRSAPIEILIENKVRKLQSGMFAKVKLILEEHKKVPVILKEAIIGRIPPFYVYVVEKDNAFLREISLGIREGPYYEVIKGINEGDRAVIIGQQKLRDGSKVLVEE